MQSGTFELPRLTNSQPACRLRRAHSSAAECLLCKEDAVGSNPTESMSAHTRTTSLIWETAFGCDTTRSMHHPVKAGWEGSSVPDLPPWVAMRSCVRAIQASTGPITVCVVSTHTGYSEHTLRRVILVSPETSFACLASDRVRPNSIPQLATVPAGERLGSSADDGRAKLR